MKGMFLVGLISGMVAAGAVKAQEAACDGPVFVPGSTVDTCDCDEEEEKCVGSTTVRNDYYTCGGGGYYGCDSMNDTIGYSGMPCTDRMDVGILAILQMAYEDCLIDQDESPVDPPRECEPPEYCDWNFCDAGTTGGTPITAQVLSGLGASGCHVADTQDSKHLLVVRMASANRSEPGS